MSSSDRRSTILATAARLFEHYGHSKTTMADVAREAHVGVGTVYLEFPSKEAIVEELSRAKHVLVLEAMRAAAASRRDPCDRLSAVLVARTDAYLALRDRGPHVCELLHCKTDAVRAAEARYREEERALLEQLVADGRAAGVFGSTPPARAAMLVQRASAFLAPPWIFGIEEDARGVARQLAELLLRGLVARADAARSPGRRAASSRG